MSNYIFTSERLGFRNWDLLDLDNLFEINSNNNVMQYFPSKLTLKDSKDFIIRMHEMHTNEGFCYFAVEIIKTKEFIGFIGLAKQTYNIDFNPSIDIGWRLHPNYWKKGFAREGAKACLHFAFNQLNISEIVSVAPLINIPSITVMKKIGMQKVKEFKHPFLVDYPALETCALYQVKIK